MANIIDYIDWRGDIPVSFDGFNEVDSLILSKLVYINFSGIVSPLGADGGVTLRDAAAAYFKKRGETGEDLGLLVPGEIPGLLRRVAQSERFGGMCLNAYE